MQKMNKPTTVIFSEKFTKAINKVFANFTNSYDFEKQSKYGISQKSYPSLDLENLTAQEAQLIYYRDFWKIQPYEQINSVDIAEKVFELAIESGTEIAHTLLQRALRSVGNPVQENGNLDKVTLIAINSANPKELLAAFRSEVAGHYRTSFEHTHIKVDVAELMLKHAYAWDKQ